MKNFIGKMAILFVLAVSTFAIVKAGDIMFQRDVNPTDHEPSVFLEIDGTFESAIKEVDRMMQKGQITLEQANQFKKELENGAKQVDQVLKDAGLTDEVREDIAHKAGQTAEDILKKLKEIKEAADD